MTTSLSYYHKITWLTFSWFPISGLCHVSILISNLSFMYSFCKQQERNMIGSVTHQIVVRVKWCIIVCERNCVLMSAHKHHQQYVSWSCTRSHRSPHMYNCFQLKELWCHYKMIINAAWCIKMSDVYTWFFFSSQVWLLATFEDSTFIIIHNSIHYLCSHSAIITKTKQVA